jgi:O-antigen/teichoic acid export membrane protein
VTESRHIARNAGWVIVQRVLHVVGAAVFALAIPRMMGPAVYGRYALLTSVSMWFALLSGLGAVSLVTRTVPQFLANGDAAGLRKLVTNLLALRAGTGVASALTYFAIIVAVLKEPDVVAATLVAGGVLARTIGNLCFSLFLGLNQAARWGLGDLLRRWLTLGITLVVFPLAGLRGACLAFLIANVVVAAYGVVKTSAYVDWSSLDVTRRYLSPYLRIGTYFALGNLLLALVHRSGETLVRLTTNDYVQVGFYGAAYSIYLTGANALWQFGLAFAPHLVALLHHGDGDRVVVLIERLLKWMTIGAALCTLAVVFVGSDLVPLVLGAAYAPVTSSLIPLTVALFMLSVGSVGRLVSLTVDRPGISAVAAALELLCFWIAGIAAAAKAGSFGASLAALLGSTLYAAVISWRMRRALPYSLSTAAWTGALALVFVPLAWLKGDWGTNALLLLVASTGYLLCLFRVRIVTFAEIAKVGQLLRPSERVAA